MVIYCNNTYFSLSTLYILNLHYFSKREINIRSTEIITYCSQRKHRHQLRYNRVRGSHEIGAGGAFVHLSSPFPSSSNFLFSLIFFFFFIFPFFFAYTKATNEQLKNCQGSYWKDYKTRRVSMLSFMLSSDISLINKIFLTTVTRHSI